MESTRNGNRGSRLALGVVLIVAFLTLAGCSTTAASPTHKPAHANNTPTPQTTASNYTIEYTSMGFIYKDTLSGYAVTFPHPPDVEPLAMNETDHLENFASFSDLMSNEFGSTGEVLHSPPDLHGQLMGWLQSVKTSGQIGASSYTLNGLDAARAKFTAGDSPAIPGFLVGQPGETVVASDGNHFYQLIALGGTSDQRQAFFDSFKRTDK
jgi:hypothetical protein